MLSETTYTDSRQQIANMLLDIESLDSARKIMRGKDKNAERIVKTKLDEFRRQEREHAENLVTVNELIEEVEYLSSRDGLPEFMTRCLTHCNRWDSLDFYIESDLNQRYQIARELLRYPISSRESLVEQTQQSQQELVDELQSLLQKVVERDFKSSIDQFLETYEKHDQLISSWQSLALISVPDKALHDQYLKMITALNSAVQLIEQIAHLFPQENNFAQTASINNHLEGNNTEDLISESASSENKSSEDTSGSSASERTDNKSKQQPDQAVKALSAALKKLKWPLGYGVLQ